MVAAASPTPSPSSVVSPRPALRPAVVTLHALLTHTTRCLKVIQYRVPTDPPVAELELLRQLSVKLLQLLLLLLLSPEGPLGAATSEPSVADGLSDASTFESDRYVV